ncbi:hypothetical protein QP324_11010 [Corynebacterium sp. UMB0012]|uniref:hypothetical protein n=1 Tax=Corynebacterium sp. UMB0012 TaxID=3046344 RepID=UPI002551C655|nr:hypothetical protein [Corynebacterium sp. UMB0012]MDK7049100.1 hypothetical protein [Corynebacterium sp. UMB0012]
MALKKISSPQIAAFTATPSTGSWARWEGQSTTWCANQNYRLVLAPGRYRVESPQGFELYTDAWSTQGKDVLITSTIEPMIYAKKDATGTIYITRLN